MQRPPSRGRDGCASAVYRDALPPECRLPSLLGVPQPDLRTLNTVDNEQQIPDIDFRDALRMFNASVVAGDGLRRTYSENETANYDWKSGRRKQQTTTTTTLPNLIYGWEPEYTPPQRDVYKIRTARGSGGGVDGIFDEYIPDFEFNLSKFGVEEESIDTIKGIADFAVEEGEQQRDEEEETTEYSPYVPDSADESFVATKPIAITREENVIDAPELSESFPVSDECFKIAASPERETDREVLSSIPKHFYSFSFSYRKKMLTDILPESLKDNAEYKNHISKILRRNSASFSNPNSSVSLEMFAPKRNDKLNPDPNANKLGSLLMEKWRMGRVFNNGTFGIIRECFDINDAENVKAVKVIPIHKSIGKLNEFYNEITMWSILEHESIVPLLDVKITNDNIFSLMPLYDEGSLFDRVKYWEAHKVSLKDRISHIISYLKSIMQSIKYLHDRGVHHGDIKLENFVLDKNNPKLCDFGNTDYDVDCKKSHIGLKEEIKREIESAIEQLSDQSVKTPLTASSSSISISDNNFGSMSSMNLALHFESDQHKQQQQNGINIGSLPYAAPELLQPCPTHTDRKADIWALGVLIHTLVMMKLPFWHIYEPRLKLKILNGDWDREEWGTVVHGQELSYLDKMINGCLAERESRMDIIGAIDTLNL